MTALFIAAMNADEEAIRLSVRWAESVSIRCPRGPKPVDSPRLIPGDKTDRRQVTDDVSVPVKC